VRVSDPANPSLAGSYDTPGKAYSVMVKDSLAYVADYNQGLQIIRVNHPSSPNFMGSYNTPGFAYDVFVKDSLAYVADYDSGLQIIKVKDPAHPSLVGGYKTPGQARDIFVRNNLAYVADYSYGLLVVDVSDPAHPFLVGSYDPVGVIYGLSVQDSLAYLAYGPTGLLAISISDSVHPSLKSSFDTPGNGYGVFVKGRYIYLADTYSMMILETPYSPQDVQDIDEETERPSDFTLYQNYPNPFNPNTTIKFKVQGSRFKVPIHNTTLTVYNLLGQKVKTLVDEPLKSGSYEVVWDGKNDSGNEVSSGVYFYRIQTSSFSETKKMVLIK
jgi:hypothetical protein